VKRVLARGAILVLAGHLAAADAKAQILINEYFTNGDWTLFEQSDDGLFSQCVAKKSAAEGNTRIQLGRNLHGENFLLVYGINQLIEPGQTEGKGRLLINGKDPQDYSGMYINDSVAEPGSKYISIFLASGFIDKLATANSVTVELARGQVKHGLKGSKEIIDRFDPCMDFALSKEGVSPALLPAGTTVNDIDNIAGAYLVRGRNPNGKYYYGTGDVSYLPGSLQVNWQWADKTEAKGTLALAGNAMTAAVEGLADPVHYTIGRDGIWRGTWSNGQGIEIMVPKRD
jgi:hypothetical protein